jgi:hypothetical protein
MIVSGEQYFHMVAGAESPRTARDGLFACPCCDDYCLTEAGGFEICENCGWEDDPAQEAQPKLAGGANRVSLSEAKSNYYSDGYADPARLSRRPNLP